jgi:curved DNA-binding protein CbpA
MTLPDYYTLLGVSSNASLEQIKQAYRRLARLYHPDLNRNSEDVRIKRLNEAYTVLSDTARRALYDIQRLEELRHAVLMEVILRQREQLWHQQPKMTWGQGLSGFVKELRKGMHEE